MKQKNMRTIQTFFRPTFARNVGSRDGHDIGMEESLTNEDYSDIADWLVSGKMWVTILLI